MQTTEALVHMRNLSKENIPFSIEYVTLNTSDAYSNGLRKVNNCTLRTGLSQEKSKKHNVLIAYVDLEDNSNKQFYLPLLTKFNEIEIHP